MGCCANMLITIKANRMAIFGLPEIVSLIKDPMKTFCEITRPFLMFKMLDAKLLS